MKTQNLFAVSYVSVILSATIVGYTDCLGTVCAQGLISTIIKPIIWTFPGVFLSLLITYTMSPSTLNNWIKFIFAPIVLLGTLGVVNHKFFGSGIFTIDKEIVAFWFAMILAISTFLYALYTHFRLGNK